MNKTNDNDIDQLIYLFSKLPGLGSRSARRIVLYLLQDKDVRLKSLINNLVEIDKKIVKCEICGNMDTENICCICSSEYRDKSVIAVVETVAELWAMERSSNFKGLYHVLGHNLSAASRQNPSKIGRAHV